MSASSVPSGAFKGESASSAFPFSRNYPGLPVSPRAPHSRPYFDLRSHPSCPLLGALSPPLFARLSPAQSSGPGRLTLCSLALRKPGTPSTQLHAQTLRGAEELGSPSPASVARAGSEPFLLLGVALGPRKLLSPKGPSHRGLPCLATVPGGDVEAPPPHPVRDASGGLPPIRSFPGRWLRPPLGAHHGSASPSSGPSLAPVHVLSSARSSVNLLPVNSTPHWDLETHQAASDNGVILGCGVRSRILALDHPLDLLLVVEWDGASEGGVPWKERFLR